MWKLCGTAALRCRDFADAAAMYERAIELQPRSVHSHEMLCDALVQLGRFDDADRIVEATPFAVTAGGMAKRARQQAIVLHGRALAMRAEPSTDASRARSRELFRAARDAFRRAREDEDEDMSLEELVCDGMLGDSRAGARLLDLMAQHPVDAQLLEQVAALLPESLGPEETRALARLLRAQASWFGGREH